MPEKGAEGTMKQVPLYEQIYRTILSDIESGVYAPGEKIPSENDLAGPPPIWRISTMSAGLHPKRL